MVEPWEKKKTGMGSVNAVGVSVARLDAHGDYSLSVSWVGREMSGMLEENSGWKGKEGRVQASTFALSQLLKPILIRRRREPLSFA
jgi:hypothetical protein